MAVAVDDGLRYRSEASVPKRRQEGATSVLSTSIRYRCRRHLWLTRPSAPLLPALVLSPSQLDVGIDQSTTKAPTTIIESTAFAISSAGQGMILTEGEGGGGPG